MPLPARQRRLVAKKIATDFDRFWEMVVDTTDDSDFLKYVYALLFRVYELHLDGKYMTKMQACRYIPLRHAATCKKYLDIAERKGFFTFEPSPTDRRKTIVKPAPQLVQFVEETVRLSVQEMSEILSEH